MFAPALLKQAESLLAACRVKKLRLVTAESCTGGLIAGVLTEIPGSSDVLRQGFVTYANEAKTTSIGVPERLIKNHGAVSEQVAVAMAEGALKISGADVSIAVTGIAGPGGGSKKKPVGLVHIASARKGKPTLCRYFVFSGDRREIRLKSVEQALELLTRQL